jgi:hypothetical protein
MAFKCLILLNHAKSNPESPSGAHKAYFDLEDCSKPFSKDTGEAISGHPLDEDGRMIDLKVDTFPMTYFPLTSNQPRAGR